MRVGKFFEIDLAEDAAGGRAELEEKLHALCRDLLSNPVIEDYQLQFPV